jgi:hypothetical protein
MALWRTARGMLLAEGRRAFKADKTEEGQHQAETHAGEAGSLQAKLRLVEVEAVPQQRERDDGENAGDRCGFEPEHGARGEADIAIRHGRGDEDG